MALGFQSLKHQAQKCELLRSTAHRHNALTPWGPTPPPPYTSLYFAFYRLRGSMQRPYIQLFVYLLLGNIRGEKHGNPGEEPH